jgi:hypothetical protein
MSGHDGTLTIGALGGEGGVLKQSLGTKTTNLVVTQPLPDTAQSLTLDFDCDSGNGFDPNARYTVLSAPNLGSFDPARFRATANTTGYLPVLELVDNMLSVRFETA